MVTARMWVAAGFGGPEVLRNIEADVPDPGPGQVTISVRACGMNPADAKHIAPGFPSPTGRALAGPHPPGKLALVNER
jgi:NADPH2:quinone reductase